MPGTSVSEKGCVLWGTYRTIPGYYPYGNFFKFCTPVAPYPGYWYGYALLYIPGCRYGYVYYVYDFCILTRNFYEICKTPIPVPGTHKPYRTLFISFGGADQFPPKRMNTQRKSGLSSQFSPKTKKKTHNNENGGFRASFIQNISTHNGNGGFRANSLQKQAKIQNENGGFRANFPQKQSKTLNKNGGFGRVSSRFFPPILDASLAVFYFFFFLQSLRYPETLLWKFVLEGAWYNLLRA